MSCKFRVADSSKSSAVGSFYTDVYIHTESDTIKGGYDVSARVFYILSHRLSLYNKRKKCSNLKQTQELKNLIFLRCKLFLFKTIHHILPIHQAHQYILASKSPYFHEMFQKSTFRNGILDVVFCNANHRALQVCIDLL